MKQVQYSPTEQTEMAEIRARKSQKVVGVDRGFMSDEFPVLRVAYPKEECIPQTALHKALQQEYELVTFESTTVGNIEAVSYIHRHDYDMIIEDTAGYYE